MSRSMRNDHVAVQVTGVSLRPRGLGRSPRPQLGFPALTAIEVFLYASEVASGFSFAVD